MKPYQPAERTSDAIKDGFDREPDLQAKGPDLVVYRAHGNSSNMIGRFFFTPQIAGIAMMNWTADMLERELNAALWDNDFRYLAKFRVFKDVKRKVGPIAQDKYQGIDRTPSGGGLAFDQYSYFKNANLFLQVQIDGITKDNWRQYLALLADEPINPGRFHRTAGKA